MASLEEDLRFQERLGSRIREQKNTINFNRNNNLRLGNPSNTGSTRIGSLSKKEPFPALPDTPPKPNIENAGSSKITRQDREAGRLQSGVGNLAVGAGRVLSAIPKAINETSGTLALALSDEKEAAAINRRIDESPIQQFGEAIDDFFQDITDINPEFQEETSQKLASGLGSAVGFLSGGLVGTAAKLPSFLLPAALGSASLGVEQVEDYKNTIKRQGGIVDANDRSNAFILGSALGTTEALPITRALGRLDKVTGGGVGRILKEGFKGGVEELTQEAVQQLGSNLIATNLVQYDSEREIFQDVGESAAIGGGVGAILNTLVASIGARRGGRFSEAEQVANAESDLRGLEGADQALSDIRKDAQNKTLLPLSHTPFQDKSVQRVLDKYLHFNKLRSVQAQREINTTGTQERVDALIGDLTEKLSNEKIDAVSLPEIEETLKFITGVENTLKQGEQENTASQELEQTLQNIDVEEFNPASTLTIRPLSRRRVRNITAENKRAIKEFNKRIAENALQRGFDASKTIDEITLGPIDFDNEVQVGDPFQELEEIEIRDPLTQRLLDLGVSLDDIQLGNIPSEGVTEIFDELATPISPARLQAINEGRNSLIDQIEGSNIDVTLGDISPNIKQDLIRSIRESDFNAIEKEIATKRAEDQERAFIEIEAIRSQNAELFTSNSEQEAVRQLDRRVSTLQDDAIRVAEASEDQEAIEKTPARLFLPIDPEASPINENRVNTRIEHDRALVEQGSTELAFLPVPEDSASLETIITSPTEEEAAKLRAGENPSNLSLPETEQSTAPIEVPTQKQVEAQSQKPSGIGNKKGNKRTKAEANQVEEVTEAPQQVIDDIKKLSKEVAEGNPSARKVAEERFGSVKELNKLRTSVRDRTLVANKEAKELSQEETILANRELVAKKSDQAVASKIQLQNNKEANSAVIAVPNEVQSNNRDINDILERQADERILQELEAEALAAEKIPDSARAAIAEMTDRKNQLLDEIEALQDDVLADEEILLLRDEIRQINQQLSGYDQTATRTSGESVRRTSGTTGNMWEIDEDSGVEFFSIRGEVDLGNVVRRSVVFSNSQPAIIDMLKVTDEQIATEKKQVERLFSKATKELTEQVDLVFVEDILDLTDIQAIDAVAKRGQVPGGLFIKGSVNGLSKDRIYVFGQGSAGKGVKVALHEAVGHYGMQSLFGKGWVDYLDKVVNSPRMLNKVVNKTAKRWNFLIEETKTGGVIVPINGKKTRITRDSARKLTEEYIADLATGFSQPQLRSVFSGEKGFIRRTVAIVKHLIGKLSINRQSVIDTDILSLLAETHSRLFNDPILKVSVTRNKKFHDYLNDFGLSLNEKTKVSNPIIFSSTQDTQSLREGYPNAKEVIGSDSFQDITLEKQERLIPVQLSPQETVTSMGAPESNLSEVNRLRESGFANTNNSAYQRYIEGLGRKIASRPVLSVFNPLGVLDNQREYTRLSGILLGNIQEISEDVPIQIFQEFSKLNSVQKQEVFDFFTTKGADESTLNVGPEMQALARQSKDLVTQLGENFTKLGLLSEESFIANKDSYLPRIYLKYLTEGKGVGKRTSFQNYLKAQKSVPDDVRAVLESQRIKDPSIVVSDTIATLGRDQALLHFFDSVNQASNQLGVTWSLRNDFVIKVNGKDWYLPDAQDHLDYLKSLKASPSELTQMSEAAKDQQDHEITLFTRAIAEGQSQAQNTLSERAIAAGFENQEQFLESNYRKLPNSKRFGSLRDAWVRKEIAQDLEDVIQITTPKDTDSIFHQWFAPRGKLEKIHQHWKQFKVPLNPPSWFRNGIGNLTLLDISSNRNSATLSKWVVEEGIQMLSGNSSQWADIARSRGLFGTTLSSQELNLVTRDFQKRLQELATEQEVPNNIQRVLPMFQKNFALVAEFASKGYGNLEGLFKTVRLRDHITEWESQTGREFNNLNETEREVLIDEAVNQANEAVFDYSKVPNFLRNFRRYPLGAPFITFTYKAFPQIIRSMARRPQKFLKYAAMPMIMQQLFMMMNPELGEDDYDKLQRDLPLHMKEKSSVMILPFKDSNGEFQYTPIGYFLPWAPFVDAGLAAANTIDPTDMASLSSSGIETVFNSMRDFGFAGGPVPQVLAAYHTGQDPFTGRPIVEEGASPLRKLNQRLTWAWGLAAPSWLTNTGFIGKVLDNSGISIVPGGRAERLDRLGVDKETAFQVGTRLFGVNTSPIKTEINRRNTAAKFDNDIRKLRTSRKRVLRDRNLSSAEKQSELRAINSRIKRAQAKKQENLQ